MSSGRGPVNIAPFYTILITDQNIALNNHKMSLRDASELPVDKQSKTRLYMRVYLQARTRAHYKVLYLPLRWLYNGVQHSSASFLPFFSR